LANVHPQTVARWHYGYRTTHKTARRPVLPGKERGQALSYLQLVEVSFVSTFRNLGFKLKEISEAHAYLSKMFQAEFPFAELELKTDGLYLLKDFQEFSGLTRSFIVVNKAGQLMWPEMVSKRLYQYEYEHGLAIRWHPRGLDEPVVIDPRIAFGAPTIQGTGVPTWVIKERNEAGETFAEISDDLGVEAEEIHAALRFEGVNLDLVA
jgi:uncharacterized protein (DUF433 family)